MLPFQYLAYFPAMVFLGKVHGPDLLIGLAGELFWVVAFAFLGPPALPARPEALQALRGVRPGPSWDPRVAGAKRSGRVAGATRERAPGAEPLVSGARSRVAPATPTARPEAQVQALSGGDDGPSWDPRVAGAKPSGGRGKAERAPGAAPLVSGARSALPQAED